MRLIVTINCDGVDASADGGIAIADMMQRRGHQVRVQAESGGRVAMRAQERGLETCGPSLRKGGIIGGLLPFRKLVREFRPDALITTRADGQTAAALSCGDVPLVRVRCDIRRPRRGRLWNIIDRRTDLVVFPSGFMVRRGYSCGRQGPVRVIPHPVDTDIFHPGEESKGDVSPRLLSIGRLSPVKGHRTLVRALTLLPEEVTALIIGPSSQQKPEEIMAYAEELGVGGRVELAGRIDDVRPVLTQGGIGTVTSLGSEVVSRAGMEMMSMSLPLLAASTNGLLDLVEDGITGLLHSPGNHRQLAAQASMVLSKPSLARELGSRARTRCLEKYSYDAVGGLWEDVLSNIMPMEQEEILRVP